MDDFLEFITITEEENRRGTMIKTNKYRQVFADKKSIRQSEFYQARASELKPEIMFEVWSLDYKNEEKLKFKNEEYKVIRTYEKDNEKTEIVATRVARNEVV
ncbi:phage head closure protein [Bacillus sp. 2205SS5-2]|uniref:phage head closure protein n=1 Tax=Bacillus sp. 2205SS5-2 TaxID=3109031 RepID=UPI0030055153